jgi:ABC-2 type transport system ATP-binding protein
VSAVSDPDGQQGQPALICTDLVVRYGELVAVDHLSFEAHSGEVVALLGPNGAGKTSTVEALEGYRAVAGGSASVLGLDPVRQHAALVPRIGVMLQRGGVYPMLSATQVLHLFAEYYRNPADPDELLDLVGLGPVRKTRWRRLSGGEQQRLSLALALVGRPEVLFLDEPTAGVDPEGRITIREIVAEQRARGICIVLTTHELTEAERLADRVVIIDHGRLLAEGTPATLASGAAGSAIRFSSDRGIDTASLASALGSGVVVIEEQPGAYRIEPPPDVATPTVVAALAAWLAERSLPVGEIRTGGSLEEAYLAITASARADAPTGEAPAADRSGSR